MAALVSVKSPAKMMPKDFKAMLHVGQSRGAGWGREGAAKGLGPARAAAPSFAEVEYLLGNAH